MKVLLVLSAIFAASSAHGILQLGTGASSQFRSQDNAGNYAFGYDEGHASGGTFRRESGSHGVKVGSYGLSDADGRQRTVSYVADAAGFRANIQTNEPGVDSSKDPAATLVNKHAAVVAAPAVHHASYVAPAHHAAYVAPAHHASYVAPAHHASYVAPAAHHASYIAGPTHHATYVNGAPLSYSFGTHHGGHVSAHYY
ncbi:hypothetical protein LAZ67_10004165 [Cordylochernes scorpioides]|uniref:Cuticle protein 14 n=1 Tax=Cordylochernes scorpioides TaxID=51811 RepID=A0ABY6KXH8_9ARAC|nr:hypothetical protein LAZ67_10004165 [Cordylochernes scorpioides]